MDKIEAIDDDPIAAAIEDFALNDGGSAAKELLAKGIAIYYSEDDTPPDIFIKKYPDGKRELVRFDKNREEVIQVL